MFPRKCAAIAPCKTAAEIRMGRFRVSDSPRCGKADRFPARYRGESNLEPHSQSKYTHNWGTLESGGPEIKESVHRDLRPGRNVRDGGSSSRCVRAAY